MNVYLDSIGCRLNQSEIEKYANQFRAAGHTVVDDPTLADVVVVNTCAVTAEAASDSRQKLRQAQRAGAAEIIATGCWSTLDPGGAQALEGVTRVVSNLDKDRLVADFLCLPVEVFDLEPLARVPLPGAHLRTRAFIKVQDGCDNHCTFCVTRLARGAGRSRAVKAVIGDVLAAQQGGAQEAVLTGVHLGSWGHDFAQRDNLQHLIHAILSDTDIPRLRLSSLEPWDLDDAFFALWNNPRMCRHLHLPLQSGCAATLRRMARNTTPGEFARLVESARRMAPDMAVTTDLIVGFPGETASEFAQSLEFVEQIDFASGHVFGYSERPQTPALRLPGKVAPAVRKARSAVMRASLAESARRFRERACGSEVEVLWETSREQEAGVWRLEGLSGNYLRVSALSKLPRWNRIDRVRLAAVNAQGLDGVIL